MLPSVFLYAFAANLPCNPCVYTQTMIYCQMVLFDKDGND